MLLLGFEYTFSGVRFNTPLRVEVEKLASLDRVPALVRLPRSSASTSGFPRLEEFDPGSGVSRSIPAGRPRSSGALYSDVPPFFTTKQLLMRIARITI
jgi:hypothetical protein